MSAPKAIPVIDIINEFGENCYKMAQYNDSIASCKVYSFYVDETVELDLMSKNLTLTNQVKLRSKLWSNFDEEKKSKLKKWLRDGPNHSDNYRPIQQFESVDASGIPYNFTNLKYNMEQRLIIVRCGLKFKPGIYRPVLDPTVLVFGLGNVRGSRVEANSKY